MSPRRNGIPQSESPRPARYFDLPIKIRYQILDLLLVRGHVSIASPGAILQRYPHWNHPAPTWSLLNVSRQMQAEATSVVFSAKNTFFLPSGPHSSSQIAWPMMMMPFIRRLDCAFHMGDAEGHRRPIEVFKLAEERHRDLDPQVPFESLTSGERAEAIHDIKNDLLFEVWQKSFFSFTNRPLDLLRLDISVCRCQRGCCRLGVEVFGMLDWSVWSSPERIEVFGAVERDHDELRLVLERKGIHAERIFFVDNQGCECAENACDTEDGDTEGADGECSDYGGAESSNTESCNTCTSGPDLVVS